MAFDLERRAEDGDCPTAWIDQRSSPRSGQRRGGSGPPWCPTSGPSTGRVGSSCWTSSPDLSAAYGIVAAATHERQGQLLDYPEAPAGVPEP